MEKNIVIVEDDVIVAEDLKESLEERGYTILSIFNNGDDAVKKMNSLKPNIVLMDIKIEGSMDGIQVAEQIKNKQELPIIFLTAYADSESIKKAEKVKPSDYIEKPVNMDELEDAIELALYQTNI